MNQQQVKLETMDFSNPFQPVPPTGVEEVERGGKKGDFHLKGSIDKGLDEAGKLETGKREKDSEQARLLSPLGDDQRQYVEQALEHFPEARIVSVRPEPSIHRISAGRMIRMARRVDGEQARVLRELWKERMAVCTIDGGQSEVEAERIALAEIVEHKQPQTRRKGEQ